MGEVKRKDVIDYLKKELKHTKGAGKESLQKTIEHFSIKQEKFKKEWDEFILYSGSIVDELNQKIKEMGLYAEVIPNEYPHQYLKFRIAALDKSIHYTNGFCSIDNIDDEYVIYDGRVAEKKMVSFDEVRKSIYEELHHNELFEICKKIKETVIDNQNNK